MTHNHVANVTMEMIPWCSLSWNHEKFIMRTFEDDIKLLELYRSQLIFVLLRFITNLHRNFDVTFKLTCSYTWSHVLSDIYIQVLFLYHCLTCSYTWSHILSAIYRFYLYHCLTCSQTWSLYLRIIQSMLHHSFEICAHLRLLNNSSALKIHLIFP